MGSMSGISKLVVIPIATAPFIFGCDAPRWHRFILPDPYPDTLHAQYSNPACDPFPIEDGEVVIEYDSRGCACTSEPLDGEMSRPATAYRQRKRDGGIEPLPNFHVDWGSGWMIGNGPDPVLAVSTQNVRLPDGHLIPDANWFVEQFLEQCSHLPGVAELAANDSVRILRRLQRTFDR
jgi:hypothetical protein